MPQYIRDGLPALNDVIDENQRFIQHAVNASNSEGDRVAKIEDPLT